MSPRLELGARYSPDGKRCSGQRPEVPASLHAKRWTRLPSISQIKSGATVPPDAVAGLRWWLGLPGNPNRTGVLVHGGDRPFSLHEVTVRPWFFA
jgi:hypothetical protein